MAHAHIPFPLFPSTTTFRLYNFSLDFVFLCFFSLLYFPDTFFSCFPVLHPSATFMFPLLLFPTLPLSHFFSPPLPLISSLHPLTLLTLIAVPFLLLSIQSSFSLFVSTFFKTRFSLSFFSLFFLSPPFLSFQMALPLPVLAVFSFSTPFLHPPLSLLVQIIVPHSNLPCKSYFFPRFYFLPVSPSSQVYSPP